MADWWKEYKEAKDQRDELVKFFSSLSKSIQPETTLMPTCENTEDLVMRQEHQASLARIESHKTIMLALAPGIGHAICLGIGMLVGAVISHVF